MESVAGFGNLDIWGSFPVITAAGVILAQILDWSTTICRHRAQPLIIGWGILGLHANLHGTRRAALFRCLPWNSTAGLCCELGKVETGQVTYEFHTKCKYVGLCSTFASHSRYAQTNKYGYGLDGHQEWLLEVDDIQLLCINIDFHLWYP